MFFLGIDIGKNSHVASLIDDKKKVIFKAFSFSNSTEGANSLINKLEPFCDSLDIAMEATGHYWINLFSFLLQKNFSVHLINPIQTDGWRNSTEIRKRKNDTIDSILIADLLRYGDFVESTLSNEDYLSLKNLTRFRSYLISSTGDLKRKTIALLDQVFPEYEKCFSDVFGKTSKEILLSFTTPQEFENISSSKLTKALENITLKKFAKKKIEELSEKAKTTIGVKFCLDSFSLQIKMLIEQISFIETQVESIEEEISTIMSKLDSPITTIPGIGPVIGATILGELGDISRFSNASKVVAYAGLDSVYHSLFTNFTSLLAINFLKGNISISGANQPLPITKSSVALKCSSVVTLNLLRIKFTILFVLNGFFLIIRLYVSNSLNFSNVSFSILFSLYRLSK